MSLIPSRSRESWLKKISASILLTALFTNSTFASPQAALTLVVSLSELKEDVRHTLVKGNFGANLFSLDTIASFLKFAGSKQQALDRIVIQPADETGNLTVMQGEKIVFSAIGYSGDDAVGGIAFTWTFQDAERTKPVRAHRVLGRGRLGYNWFCCGRKSSKSAATRR